MNRDRKSPRRISCAILTTLLVILIGHAIAGQTASITDFSPGLLEWVKDRWGRAGVGRLTDWQKLDQNLRGDALESVNQEKDRPSNRSPLKQVNSFFNKIPYVSLARYWGGENYWATPVEMLGGNTAFCVHYATSKYLTLKDLNIPVERMRITYVRAKDQGEWHMVLAYYPTPDADPLILDNLTGEIKPASQRPDLAPVYSFNDDDMWVGSMAKKGGSTQVRQWRELLEKLQKEKAM